MKFSDQYQDADELCFSYQHESFDKAERIWFADVKTDGDSRRIELLQQELADGDADPAMVAQEYGRALFVCMARKWTIRVPKEFKASDGKPHELAGGIPPLGIEWVRKLPEPVLIGSLQAMLDHYSAQMTTKEGTKSAQSADEDPPIAEQPRRLRPRAERVHVAS